MSSERKDIFYLGGATLARDPNDPHKFMSYYPGTETPKDWAKDFDEAMMAGEIKKGI